jgi:hypothetical protein
MKIEKTGIKSPEFRVWCEYCSIRVAPKKNRPQLAAKPIMYAVT